MAKIVKRIFKFLCYGNGGWGAKFISIFVATRDLLKVLVFRFLAIFFHGKHWVICERGTDARDNGYFFYKYMKKSYPEIKVYYFIDKKSADYDKVKEDAIQHGSLKSFWLAFTAKKIVSSHYRTIIPYSIRSEIFAVSGLSKKYYFLQHGVIKDTIPSLLFKAAPMKLFICGAKPEYDFIVDTYGHPEGVVQYTGLARFDNLHDIETKKQILVMPTWRSYIRSEEDFLKSEWYLNWQEFLSDTRLLKKLDQTNIKLIFYPHYEMQKYLHLFKTNSDNIVLATFADYDVQTLLKESAVLVTDYSSVFFDFAYMKKPVVYFQFDKESFYAGHYKKGYFDYYDTGFGDVCETSKEVVDSLMRSFDIEFKMSDLYLARTESFFPLYDKNNCDRIYNLIVSR